MLTLGWTKLYRSITSWEWFQDARMVQLWVYLLSQANDSLQNWQGIEIQRGQLVTSVNSICLALKATPKEIRLRLEKLSKTGEIVTKTTNKFTIVSICKYDIYQLAENKKGKQRANKGQTEDKQRANEGQTEDKQRATMKEDISINHTNIEESKNKEEVFFKSEKKIFEISEIENELMSAGVYMSKLGIQKFKETNENPANNFNYNGGIVNAAGFFLKKFPEYIAKGPQKPQITFENLSVAPEVAFVLHETLVNCNLQRSQIKALEATMKPLAEGDTLICWFKSASWADNLKPVKKEFEKQILQKWSSIEYKSF